MKATKSHFLQPVALIRMIGSVGLVLACGSAHAAITQAQYDTMLASALKTMVLPCKSPRVNEPTTRAEADALYKAGQEFAVCVKEHDGLRIRYHNMEVTPNNALAGKMSGPQIDAYRTALKEAIQADVDKNRPMISATFAKVDDALESYVVKSRPDAPQSVFGPILARLDRYEYSCIFPSVPDYVDSRGERAAFGEQADHVYECDAAWVDNVNELSERNLNAVASEAELNSLSYAQGKELFSRVIEMQLKVKARNRQRQADWDAFNADVDDMRERSDQRAMARRADAQEIRDIQAMGAAAREAIRSAGEAVMENNGRFAPVPIPKRPGQL